MYSECVFIFLWMCRESQDNTSLTMLESEWTTYLFTGTVYDTHRADMEPTFQGTIVYVPLKAPWFMYLWMYHGLCTFEGTMVYVLYLGRYYGLCTCECIIIYLLMYHYVSLNAPCSPVNVLWRPCNFTLLYSLTGPVGQPFASCLGGQRFASWGCTNSQWNRISPVSVVSLHWWPWCDWSLASP
jgi:hypothetical protein